jgi:hypothetical protein
MLQGSLFSAVIGAVGLVLSVCASQPAGAKPPKQIILSSPPMLTNATECSVLNVGDTLGLPVIGICIWEQLNDGNLDLIGCNPEAGELPVELDPGHTFGTGQAETVDSVPTFNDLNVHRVYCEVEFEGQPGDISGAFCGDLGCLPLK